MPEMLKPTSLIIGAGFGLDVACLTDGRFSGGYERQVITNRLLLILNLMTARTVFALAISSPKLKLVVPSR
jgi:hypothetical protein